MLVSGTLSFFFFPWNALAVGLMHKKLIEGITRKQETDVKCGVETQFLILVATVERRSEPNFLMPRGTLRPSFLLANFELARALFVLTAEKTRSSGRLHQMRDATIGSRVHNNTSLCKARHPCGRNAVHRKRSK